MKPLSELAEEYLQKMYEGTFDYTYKSVGVDLRNVLVNRREKDKEPRPQYKDTMSSEEYWQEVVAIMDSFYENPELLEDV